MQLNNSTPNTPPTIPASRVAELLASTPGARYFPQLGAIMAPPRPENPTAVGRIVAYVEKPQPLVFQCDRPLTVNVSEAEDVLLTYLRTGTVSEPPAADPTYRAQMIAEGATESELDGQVAQWMQDQADLRRALWRFISKTAPKKPSKRAPRDTAPPPSPEELDF